MVHVRNVMFIKSSSRTLIHCASCQYQCGVAPAPAAALRSGAPTQDSIGSSTKDKPRVTLFIKCFTRHMFFFKNSIYDKT